MKTLTLAEFYKAAEFPFAKRHEIIEGKGGVDEQLRNWMRGKKLTDQQRDKKWNSLYNNMSKTAKEDSSITGPMAGSIVGGNVGIGVREMMMAKKKPKGVKGALALAVPGLVGSIGGLYAGQKLSREKKANLMMNVVPKLKGAATQIKDAGKVLKIVKP